MKLERGGRQFDLCYMTATWRGDLDRFALLRESLMAFGHGGIPHYALINTEDAPLLQALQLPDVIPVTTAELLAPEVEAGRLRYAGGRGGRRWKTLQRSLHKRFGLFPDARFYGWQVQQLIKLQAGTQLPHDVFVCFDSDNVVCGDFDPADFVPDGRVALFESTRTLVPGEKVWSWYGNARRLLGLPVPDDYERSYVSQPVVFAKHALQAMHAWLEKTHGRPWYESFLAQPLSSWSEFMTYGVFVRDHLKLEGFEVVTANAENRWIAEEADRRNADALIRQAFAAPGTKLLVLQADHHHRWPLSRFLPVLREQLAAVTARRNLGK